MQNPFNRSSLARPLFTVLALTGAGLGACGAASSEDPTALATEGADSTPSDADEATPPPASTPSAASTPTAGQNLFHAPQPWTRAVSALPKSDKSDRIMGWLSDHGGWGTPRLRIEFSIKVLHATSEVPFREF